MVSAWLFCVPKYKKIEKNINAPIMCINEAKK